MSFQSVEKDPKLDSENRKKAAFVSVFTVFFRGVRVVGGGGHIIYIYIYMHIYIVRKKGSGKPCFPVWGTQTFGCRRQRQQVLSWPVFDGRRVVTEVNKIKCALQTYGENAPR